MESLNIKARTPNSLFVGVPNIAANRAYIFYHLKIEAYLAFELTDLLGSM